MPAFIALMDSCFCWSQAHPASARNSVKPRRFFERRMGGGYNSRARDATSRSVAGRAQDERVRGHLHDAAAVGAGELDGADDAGHAALHPPVAEAARPPLG